MKIVERNGIPFKIIADKDMKITNKERNIFSDKVFISVNDDISNWEEVGYDVWKYFIDEAPVNKVEELESAVRTLIEGQISLGDILLDTDFRLMCLEMGITP